MERKLNYNCICSRCNQDTLSRVQQIETISDDLCDVKKRYEHRVNTSKLYETINLPERFEHTC